ncbi:MAG: hypothetical protein HQ541_22035 [Mariniphaga sp.]|nr:hypothetical protein [Mariniphaga sp.]
MSFVSSTELATIKKTQAAEQNWIDSRMAFMQQLLLARKFNDNLSIQIAPTYIYRNIVGDAQLDKNLFALGIGGRYRISGKVFLNAEYILVHRENPEYYGIKYYNPLSFGVDIITGGHVFQITITNSRSMRENGFIGNTIESWTDGGIHLGFNISRTFIFY